MASEEFKQQAGLPPKLDLATVRYYLKTRFTTLLPSREQMRVNRLNINPFGPLSQLTKRNWAFIGVAICTWTWDSVDFFIVSLNASTIAKDLEVSVKDVTWGLTLVLMVRSVGAIGFGIWGDRKGNKYPLIACMALLSIIQIGSGFVTTYKQFLGVRAIFGVAMGGVYGNAASCALDDCPAAAKGIVSGMFQEAYMFGYLVAVLFQRAIAVNSPYGWRALFWFSAGPPVLFIAWRFWLPQTDDFLKKKEIEANEGVEGSIAFRYAKETFKNHWLMFIYLVVLLAAFNFGSHGSQDLYPTLLTKQLGYGNDRSTVTNSPGGVFFGHASTFIGRRLTVLIACVLGGTVIYPWAYARDSGINAGVFFLQFCISGAWGVVPVHLSSLADPKWRSLIVGTSYQLGNLASSGSSTIQATIGERFPLYDANGVQRPGVYDYSKVMAIFMGCVFAFLMIVMFLGPEKKDEGEGSMITDDESLVGSENTDNKVTALEVLSSAL
ncbi:hypothetical protein BABINDRAFT_178871 [Babjeviella inositovora NRRL Y-12698]|uniref:Major facilitator superfamily (MFS) profile domain-containing protein n=1 Tax=Babjeviella inositovora NRRL Y-12698 TaxID=984486 RepID=A0A1E3R039_9ASCO|nr:uncharacterized protein BABINDRAFT_178871 [Babjeviella inositovora NRRL Y-12698]ODQ82727.1 hypothetical protein BABINDRAFT_178871 [Babjeviella inositovora NRRL Y-12698]